jgi:transformation/transcription domain-associated protein
MIEDLVARFKPTPEEEFLRTTHVLLEECLKQALNALDRAHDHWANRVGFVNLPGGKGQQSWLETFPKKALVPRQIATHLKRVLETFFTPTNSPMMKYRARFEADFGNMESGELTLDGCLLRLHEWHRHMSSLISRMPKNHRLEDFSHFLMTFSGGHAEIDLPGEHLVRHSFQQQSHTFIRIERFLSEVKVVHKHSAAFRQVTIRGRDGRLYPYLIQQASTRHARTEERFMHFLRMLNMMLDKRKESRKRSLTYYVPRVVPLNVHVRLVQHPASVLSLEDVFQEFCASSQTYVDQPTIDSYVARRDQFQKCHNQFERYTAQTGRGIREFFGEMRNNDANKAKAGTSTSTDIRKEIFDTIRKEKVPMDILRRFMLATFPDHTDVWMFQRQFTSQLALSAFASYVLMLVKGAPHTLLFALDTGNIYPWDLNVTFNRDGEIVAPEPVPFRLTPNLVNFITPVGITGLFSSAMISAAEAISDTEFKVQNYLGALLRDEMISWHAINREPYAKSAITNTQLVKLVATNTQKISVRLEALSNAEGTKLVQTRTEQQHWACKEADTLIKQATGTKNLCNMPPMWHPWL